MPGLFGIVSPTNDFQLTMERFRRIHAFAGADYVESSHVFGSCLLATITPSCLSGPQSQIGRINGKEIGLVLEGEIFNTSGLCNSRSQIQSKSQVCNALLEMYLDNGPDFINKVDGEFNIAIYDADSAKLSVFSDHLASHPLYYFSQANEFLFASEKKTILTIPGHASQIDPVGLLQLVIHQHNLGDRTFLSGIKRLPPSACLVYEKGQVSLSVNGDINTDDMSNRSASRLLEEWQDELRSATAKRVRGKSRLLFSLSAGLDSRAIACAIERDVRPIVARTMGNSNSHEVRYAREISKYLSFDHITEDDIAENHSGVVRKTVWRTEGEIQFHHALSIANHEQMKTHGDHLIGGWLGDISSGAHIRPFMLKPQPRSNFVEQVFQWYRIVQDSELHNIFNSEFLATNLPIVRDAFHESFAQYDGEANWRAFELWDLHNRQTRLTISSMPVDSHLFGKVRPFFDRSYLRFAMSVPLRFRLGQNLYKSLIFNIGPEIRSVPNSNTNTVLRRSQFANFGEYVWSSGRRVGTRNLRRMAGKTGSNDGRLLSQRDLGLKQIVVDFVNSSYFDDQIFDRSGILNVVEEHYCGRVDYSILVSCLATFAIALPYFAYERMERCPTDCGLLST